MTELIFRKVVPLKNFISKLCAAILALSFSSIYAMLVSNPSCLSSDSYVKIKPPKERFLTQKQALKMSDPAPSQGELPEMLILIDAQDGTFHYAKVEDPYDDSHQYIYDYHRTHTVILHNSDTRVLKLAPLILYQPRLPLLLLASWFRDLAASQKYEFFPFLRGRIIHPDTITTVIGDLHGHEKAWRKIVKKLYGGGILNKEGKIDSNHIIVFLGDLTDRGPFGLEIWYKVLQLAIKNPQQVFIQSGNHGTPCLTKNFHPDKDYSFYCQLKKITSLGGTELEALLQTIYTQLPQGVLFGIDPQYSSPDDNSPYHFIFLCHGGFDPFACILKELMKQLIENHKKTKTTELDYIFDHNDPEHSGYLWTDFRANSTPDERPIVEPSGRGLGLYRYNTSAAQCKFRYLMSKKAEHPCILDCLVRGHEHIEYAIGKLNTTVDKGGDWAPLEDEKTKFVDNGSVYTVISSTKYALPSTTMQRIAYMDIGFSREKKQFYATPHIFSKTRKIIGASIPQ